jgi:hypothetical protein
VSIQKSKSGRVRKVASYGTGGKSKGHEPIAPIHTYTSAPAALGAPAATQALATAPSLATTATPSGSMAMGASESTASGSFIAEEESGDEASNSKGKSSKAMKRAPSKGGVSGGGSVGEKGLELLDRGAAC